MYWKPPRTKQWYSLYVDGKCIGTIEEGAAFELERKKLLGLAGVIFRPALPEEMIKVNAKTFLPTQILDKMRQQYLAKSRVKVI